MTLDTVERLNFAEERATSTTGGAGSMSGRGGPAGEGDGEKPCVEEVWKTRYGVNQIEAIPPAELQASTDYDPQRTVQHPCGKRACQLAVVCHPKEGVFVRGQCAMPS